MHRVTLGIKHPVIEVDNLRVREGQEEVLKHLTKVVAMNALATKPYHHQLSRLGV